MHAPIERKAVGIQREPQRLRFQLPEIVQGERRQADDDRAIAAWMRAQLMPVLDRSIAAIIGDKQLRKTKRPIGLRGKYYPDYRPPDIAKRFVVHPPKRWAWRMWPMRYENGRIVVNVPEPSSEREGHPIRRSCVAGRLRGSQSAGPRSGISGTATANGYGLPFRG